MAKIQLVLGSGGARGMAHIGVIESLENDGHTIVEVVGCSMGAVVGGIYAAGYLREYKEWLLNLNRNMVLKLLDFTITKQGFVRGEKVFEAILNIIGPQNIEDLKIPFTAIATDMQHRKEVVFKHGDLFHALRASISIPGIFTPVREDDTILVDGGVLNPLPLNLVSHREDCLLVAVNINARDAVHEKEESEVTETTQKEKKGWSLFPLGLGRKNLSATLSLVDLLQISYDFTQDRLTDMMLEVYKPDLLIDIPRTSCGTFEFYKAREIIDLGKQSYDLAKTLPPKQNQLKTTS